MNRELFMAEDAEVRDRYARMIYQMLKDDQETTMVQVRLMMSILSCLKWSPEAEDEALEYLKQLHEVVYKKYVEPFEKISQ